MDGKHKKFVALVAIESAFVVQVAWGLFEDRSGARIRSSLVELGVIAVILVIGWRYILGRK